LETLISLISHRPLAKSALNMVEIDFD
jgi:hypothetical protein